MEEMRYEDSSSGPQSARSGVLYPSSRRVETHTQTPSCKRISDLQTGVGPGTYRIASFVEELEKKPGSLRGICDTREKRFKDFQSATPGPGAYGKWGIPSAALEEKERKSLGPSISNAEQRRFYTNTMFCSTFGLQTYVLTIRCLSFTSLLSQLSLRSFIGLQDSGLGPGTYNLKSFTELILSRRVSKRGPYDLSTGNGNCFTAPKWESPDPGIYHKVLPKFGDELQKPEKRKHGVFGSREQYPTIPTERICLSTLSQCPRTLTSPGPGWYNTIAMTPKYRLESGKQAPFLSSTPRISKRTELLMNKNHNPVGPGRYNIAESSSNKKKNSHRSSFISGTQRYLHCPERDKFNQERLRSSNVPLDRRSVSQREVLFR